MPMPNPRRFHTWQTIESIGCGETGERYVEECRDQNRQLSRAQTAQATLPGVRAQHQAAEAAALFPHDFSKLGACA